ncbi:GNAT family N-acetyltransferase [Bacillus tuaregi]|uniref:GNAT family N-acetyltransferase n=1 Tax=Bacillus tuaregi TaxID=1816695 RepID=UPI0008F8511A|nr:GNAT family protein [Bacillus tuaregi]
MLTLKVDQEIELRLLQLQDSNPLYKLVDNNREHLRQWLPWVDNIYSSLQYHTIIPTWLKQYADHNGFHAGIHYKNKLVGVISLHSIDWYNKQTSIGYYLGKGFEGKGIMTKSVQAVLNYLFFHLHLHRAEVRCGEFNLKSRAIPERLGFKREGLIRDGEFLYDHYHDLVVYGILYNEWLQRKEYPPKR